MENSVETPKPVYVYPLPAKTQGEHGNSKAYRISIGILWVCFLLPIIGIVFVIDELIFSYISTNIFIIFFVIYFKFYKSPVFLLFMLVMAVLIIPAAHAASFIIPFIPNISPRGFGEVYPLIEFNFSIGIVFFVFLHAINMISSIALKKNIKQFITILILCETSSLLFYFTCIAIFGRFYEGSIFLPTLEVLY